MLYNNIDKENMGTSIINFYFFCQTIGDTVFFKNHYIFFSHKGGIFFCVLCNENILKSEELQCQNSKPQQKHIYVLFSNMMKSKAVRDFAAKRLAGQKTYTLYNAVH